jgi:hypothetical protein
MNYSKKILLPSGRRGMDLLDTPVWNKGTENSAVSIAGRVG